MKIKTQIDLNVNGKIHHVSMDLDRTLLDFLRNELGLTAAKNACDEKGICGACTVIVNGRAIKSCQVKLRSLDKTEIVTIEGLEGRMLHPLQAAFVKEGAIQCGFCTPGMIMAAKALLDENPNPTEKEIAYALQGNLCRCTGYIKIIQAVKEAAAAIRSGEPIAIEEDSEGKPSIGAPLPPKMAVEKATGRFLFLDDLPATDALVVKIVWSAHDHAHIRSVETGEARRVPGVIEVLTSKDIPGQNAFGLIREDQPVLCSDRARYRGDPIALVLARNAHAAQQGVSLIKVDYDPLPAVFAPEHALTDSAPRLFSSGNLACEFTLKHGDVSAALQDAAVVVSGEFSTPAVEHAYLEPEGGVAEWKDGRITLRSASQYPHEVRRQIAKVLGQPKETIRVIAHPTGGAFGGKTDISIHALLAVAAKHTQQKVTITLSREESLRASVKRHPMKLLYQIGFDRQGSIVGMQSEILANSGAYHALSIPLLEQTTAFATGPYRVPSLRVRVRGVFTNTPPSSAFRGFGIPQPTFAVESLVDEAAEKLGLSPIEIRRRNALRPGDRSATGQIMGPDTHLVETLDALEEDYTHLSKHNRDSNVGVGVACGYKNIGLGLGEEDYGEVHIEVLPTGQVHLRVGAIDLGQGSSTILAQIAACELGIPYRLVDVEAGDTDRTPDARETNASRQSVVSGNAVLQAVINLRQRAVALATDCFPELQAPVSYQDGHVIDALGQGIGIFKLVRRLASAGERLDATGKYVAPKTVPLSHLVTEQGYSKESGSKNYFAYAFFSNLAVVRVDRKSGQTQVRQIVSAYDVGRVLNRLTLEGQLEGGAIMGMGYALSEEYISHGRKVTNNLAQCGLPRSLSTPRVISHFVEEGDSAGPYGAKGVGEVAMVAIAPAITNAIHNTVGVRLRDLPATPVKIRRALTEQGANWRDR